MVGAPALPDESHPFGGAEGASSGRRLPALALQCSNLSVRNSRVLRDGAVRGLTE